MADTIDDLLSEVKSLQNAVNGNPEPVEEPVEPVVQIPEKKWYHIADTLTRRDELLEAILLALRDLKAPPEPPVEEPPPMAPSPTAPSPVVPSPAPSFPPGVEPKLDSLIVEQAETKTLMEGFPFKTGQATVVSAGTGQQLLHQFKTYLVVIRAHTTNTNNIYIGDKGVSATQGYILSAGEAIAITIDVLKKGIYFDSDTSGDGVSWMALV